MALKSFLRLIWWRSRYLKSCPRTGLSSAHQIVALRTVEVKLSYRKRAKDQILFFRANWDSRNFWVLVSFWGIFQLQVALKNFLWVIWWCSRYLKDCPRWGLSRAHRIMTDWLFICYWEKFYPPLLLVLDDASLNPLIQKVASWNAKDLNNSKKWSKKAMILIFFFQWKLRFHTVQLCNLGDHRGTWWMSVLVWSVWEKMKIYNFPYNSK